MKDDRIARSLDAQGNPVSESLLRQQRIERRKRHAAENICAKDAFINNSPGATRMSSRRGDIGSVQSAHRNSGETDRRPLKITLPRNEGFQPISASRIWSN
jgi:hypothetical protein